MSKPDRFAKAVARAQVYNDSMGTQVWAVTSKDAATLLRRQFVALRQIVKQQQGGGVTGLLVRAEIVKAFEAWKKWKP